MALVANVLGREPAQVAIYCPRCSWKGTADQAPIIITGADGAKMPYCPKCTGPCCEVPKEEPAKPDAS